MRASDGRLRLWFRRHRHFQQCGSAAVDGQVSYPCTRARWHTRYDPLHFNVFERLAWEPQVVMVAYPATDEAVRRIRQDQGRAGGSDER